MRLGVGNWRARSEALPRGARSCGTAEGKRTFDQGPALGISWHLLYTYFEGRRCEILLDTLIFRRISMASIAGTIAPRLPVGATGG